MKILLLVLVLLLLFSHQGRAHNASYDSTKAELKAVHALIQHISHATIRPVISLTDRDIQKHIAISTRQIMRYTFWSLLFSGAALFLLYRTLLYTRFAIRAANDTLDQARFATIAANKTLKAAENAEKAYIFVEPVVEIKEGLALSAQNASKSKSFLAGRQGHPVEDSVISVAVKLTNAGKTPATDILFDMQTELTCNPDDMEVNWHGREFVEDMFIAADHPRIYFDEQWHDLPASQLYPRTDDPVGLDELLRRRNENGGGPMPDLPWRKNKIVIHVRYGFTDMVTKTVSDIYYYKFVIELYFRKGDATTALRPDTLLEDSAVISKDDVRTKITLVGSEKRGQKDGTK